jgi:dTDP-4-dehydrorhamnose reductase
MIVVTGATGQVGHELQTMLGSRAIFLSRESLDLTRPEAVSEILKKHQCTLLINAAAHTQVDKAESERDLAMQINGTAPGVLASAALDAGARFIHFSTDYVFDGKASTPYLETDATAPQGVYGESKLAGEKNALAAHPEALVIRTSWVYANPGKNFVKTILRAGEEREELRVVYDQVGSLTWARDIADVALRAADKKLHGIYHFSSEGVASWYDIAVYLKRKTGFRAKVTPIRSAEYPTAAVRPAYSVLDKAKLKAALGTSLPHWTNSLDLFLVES